MSEGAANREPSARAALGAWLADRRARLAPLGDGHINDTFLVTSDGARYVLQRISAAVFPDPEGIAAKVADVTGHLRGAGRIRVPALLDTRSGAGWHRDPAGAIWRLSEYLAGTRTLPQLTNAAQARAAGRAFGRFQQALADFPRPLAEPIPHFMRLAHYLSELDAALREASPEAEVETLAGLVERRRDLAGEFAEADRLVHGDCKVNNLLYAADRDEVAAVVDLDTVMHGHWAWDFGDLVRSAAADSGAFSVERFAAVAAGFREQAAIAGSPPAIEHEALLRAPRYVTLMLGVRFLTDHLRGDRYFKVTAPGDNLRRARQQFELLEAMEGQELQMSRVL